MHNSPCYFPTYRFLSLPLFTGSFIFIDIFGTGRLGKTALLGAVTTTGQLQPGLVIVGFLDLLDSLSFLGWVA